MSQVHGTVYQTLHALLKAQRRAQQHDSTKLPHLSNHGAPVVDELGQHHGYVVIDGGGVIGPFR